MNPSGSQDVEKPALSPHSSGLQNNIVRTAFPLSECSLSHTARVCQDFYAAARTRSVRDAGQKKSSFMAGYGA